MRLSQALFCGALSMCFVPAVLAQDATKVDAKHYKVVSENNEVRILRVHYGPHEKSVMHAHPDAVVVYLTDGKTKMTDANGKTEMHDNKAGTAMFTPKTVHMPENVGDQGVDVIVVELKGH